MPTCTYEKEVPGATLEFMPGYIREYDGEEWDVRVSIDQTPLDESFYFTVNRPDDVKLTLRELLDTYVLNQDKRSALDVSDDPDLPFYQDELIQLFNAFDDKRMSLEFFVNKKPGKVQLDDRAENLLSAACYDDDSLDYRLLDLVVRPVLKFVDYKDKSDFENRYDLFFLLHLMAFLEKDSLAGMLDSFDMQRAFAKRFGYRHKTDLLEMTQKSLDFDNVSLTEQGRAEWAKIDTMLTEYDARYAPFGSVSLEPPALGVESGFDVSLQIMEIDGIDVDDYLTHKILDARRTELFTADAWQKHFLERTGIDDIFSSIAWKTSFTAEALEPVLNLALGK